MSSPRTRGVPGECSGEVPGRPRCIVEPGLEEGVIARTGEFSPHAKIRDDADHPLRGPPFGRLRENLAKGVLPAEELPRQSLVDHHGPVARADVLAREPPAAHERQLHHVLVVVGDLVAIELRRPAVDQVVGDFIIRRVWRDSERRDGLDLRKLARG